MNVEWLGLLRFALLGGMLIGWLGLIVPFFPGITVIWLAALFYGIAAGFGQGGTWYFLAITVLAILGWLADNVLMIRFARKGRRIPEAITLADDGTAREGEEEGASWLSIALAFVAGVVGSIVLSPLGGIAATLGALLLVEYLRERDLHRAWDRTWRMAMGWGWAIVARMSIGLLMIALWAIWAW